MDTTWGLRANEEDSIRGAFEGLWPSHLTISHFDLLYMKLKPFYYAVLLKKRFFPTLNYYYPWPCTFFLSQIVKINKKRMKLDSKNDFY